MSQTLAVKYRPRTLTEICGQSLTTQILQKAIEKQNFKNCYLFAGDSGCGKTSCARAFANAINQGLGSPIEIDAASNNGVDQVRAIVEAGKHRAIDSEYKIFIIDECHAITTAGWQAYLKGLEETPPYTIYIFCTTEPHKIQETALNRMQRYNITKIANEDICARLKTICEAEGFTNYDEACDFISKVAHGCMRDAIAKLEQCADFNTDLCLTNVKQVLTETSYEAMFILSNALLAKDIETVFYVTDKLYNTGADLKNFIELYIEFILDMTKYSLSSDMSITNIPGYLINSVEELNYKVTNKAWFNTLVDLLLRLKLDIRYDASYKSTIEAYLMRFCRS